MMEDTFLYEAIGDGKETLNCNGYTVSCLGALELTRPSIFNDAEIVGEDSVVAPDILLRKQKKKDQPTRGSSDKD